MSWRLFNWGSRGPMYDTGGGVYVATLFTPQCIEVVLFGTDCRGDELIHKFDVRAAHSPPTLGDCDLVCTAVHNWCTGGANKYETILSQQVHIDRVVATSVAVFEGPQSELAIGVVGTLHENQLPSEVTKAFKKAGDNVGRSRRGRLYAWPTGSSMLDPDDANKFNTTYLNAANTVFMNLIAGLTAIGQDLVIRSFVRNLLYDVSRFVYVTPFVDHQDRRGAGRGR